MFTKSWLILVLSLSACSIRTGAPEPEPTSMPTAEGSGSGTKPLASNYSAPNTYCCWMSATKEEYIFTKTEALAEIKAVCEKIGSKLDSGACGKSDVTLGCKIPDDPRGFQTTIWKTKSATLQDCLPHQTKLNP